MINQQQWLVHSNYFWFLRHCKLVEKTQHGHDLKSSGILLASVSPAPKLGRKNPFHHLRLLPADNKFGRTLPRFQYSLRVGT